MNRPWNPNRTGWLSPDAYAALSPAEKRTLWRQRQGQRRVRGGGGGRQGHYARRKLLWMAIVFGALGVLKAVDTASKQWFNVPSEQVEEIAPATPQKVQSVAPVAESDPADAEWATRGGGEASPSTPPDRVRGFGGRAVGAEAVRASFSYCKWGGGTNCVVDGDTFYIGGAKVRIAGIDAPETHDYRCASELQLGEQAASQLQALLNSGAVTMSGIGRDRDPYGRLLRNVSVNGQDVGDVLMSAGLARAYAGGRKPWC